MLFRSQTSTQEALRVLAPDVTLAFAPYGSSLDRWTQRARTDGHELLLQIPMEPFDYPDNDPGPQTLLTSATSDVNVERLSSFLGRLTNYVGVVNYMGAKFTADDRALSPVVGELATRGLMYLDDGSSSRSTTFSMPEIAMCTRGSAAVSRALPSFSVIEIWPVSATRKFAPVIPTSAST